MYIYTDGSKTDNGRVAAAFYVPSADVRQAARLNDDVTIYAAEMTAINMVLQWLVTLEKLPTTVIFSDSLSSLQSLRGNKHSSRPNLMTTRQLLDAVSDNVTLAWVPGHSSISGNETVDGLAKNATQHGSTDINIGYELQDGKATVEQYIDKKWQQQWTTSTKGRHFYRVQPRVSRHAQRTCNNRRKETTTGRLRLGKCCLNQYLYVIKQHPTGLCANCNVPETIEHHLLECPTSKATTKLKQTCTQLGHAYNLETILSTDELLDTAYSALDRRI